MKSALKTLAIASIFGLLTGCPSEQSPEETKVSKFSDCMTTEGLPGLRAEYNKKSDIFTYQTPYKPAELSRRSIGKPLFSVFSSAGDVTRFTADEMVHIHKSEKSAPKTELEKVISTTVISCGNTARMH